MFLEYPINEDWTKRKEEQATMLGYSGYTLRERQAMGRLCRGPNLEWLHANRFADGIVCLNLEQTFLCMREVRQGLAAAVAAELTR